MQPDHPPYPRPVPYIDCDEDILLSGAIVIFQSHRDEDSDFDQIAAKRAAKRRRIQHHAHAYLRGQGISILSAGLRGPFNTNWGNPWIKSDGSAHLASRVRRSEQGVHNARLDEFASNSLPELGKSTSIKTPAPITTPLVNPFHRVTNLIEAPHSSNEKVEGWLRRNSALYPQKNFTTPLSPTPKRKSSPIQHRPDPKYRWTPTKQLITVNSQDLRAPLHGTHPYTDEASETDVPVEKPKAAPKDAHSRLQNALRSQTDYRALLHELQARSPPGLAKTLRNPDRAEAEILRIKHYPNEDEMSMSSDKQSYQNALYREIRKDENSNTIQPERNSLVTPPVSDQEQMDKAPRQFLNTLEKNKHVLAVTEISSQHTHTPWKSKLNQVPQISSQPVPSKVPSSDTQVRESDGAENKCKSLTQKATTLSQANAIERQIPALSTAPSNAQSILLPPSAQHKPDLQAMPSNASSSIRLLEALSMAVSIPHEEEKASAGSNIQDAEQSNDVLPNEGASHLDNNLANSEPSQNGEPSKDIKLVNSPAKEMTNLCPIQNSSLHKSTSNAEHSLHNDTTKLSITYPGLQTNSVQKRQHSRRSKQDKKAAFAPEASSMSSNESIKSVLKVRKGDTGTKRALKSPPPSFNESKSELNNPEGENSMHSSPVTSLRAGRKLSAPRSSSTGRKGILKSTNPPPLASRQQAPIPGFGEEEFDLNGAIDELGSFLSTWDAEKDGLKVV